MKTAMIFPGQGAQFVGMGLDFAENFAAARETFEEADDLLGRSLSRVIFSGPESLLVATHNSQVAIFVTSIAILRVLELEPQVCGGLSLGEWTALVASGRLTFAEALPLVQMRGTLMSQACEETKGAMAAIVGLGAEQVEELVAPVKGLWVANLNCPGQVVISGTQEAVEQGSLLAKEAGAKRAIALEVHGAFHSGLMTPARDAFAPAVQATQFAPSEVPLAMNAYGALASSEEQIPDGLIRQVTDSVRWEECIRAMGEVDRYLEIGPGKVLAGFNKRIGVNAPTLSIQRIEDLEKLGEAHAV